VLKASSEVLCKMKMAQVRRYVVALAGIVSLFAPSVAANAVPAVGTSARLATPTITCWGKERAADHYKIVYTERLVVRHPMTCSNSAPYVDTAQEVILHDLKWSSWGSSTATATGSSQVLGARSPGEPSEIPATVTVSDIKSTGARRWYAELSVTTSYGAGHYRLRSPTASNSQTF
jgi:hypothetical protein